MKVTKTHLLIIIVSVCLFNCKKYPEGGCERRGPKNIVGDWKLALYEVNGVDSTNLINYNGNDGYKTIRIYKNVGVFQIDQKSSIGNSASFTNNNTKIRINGGLVNNGQKCILDAGINYCYRLFFTPESSTIEWEIQKLTKNELIITTNIKNTYKIRLNK